MLGADYTIENGRYRFARVYDGENWNPQLRAPLTQPGVNVKAGEYLLAVNGRDLHCADEIYSFFQETAGRQMVLKVGPNPDGTGSREVTVVPVDNEIALRDLAWIEDNRRKVDQLSGGSWPMSICRTRPTAGTPILIATTSPKRARRPRYWTNATTAAAIWPTTSSTICGVRS